VFKETTISTYKYFGNNRARICKRLRSSGIDSKESIHGRPVRQIGLPYRSARFPRLATSIPWDRFLSSLSVYKFGLWFFMHVSQENCGFPACLKRKLDFFWMCEGKLHGKAELFTTAFFRGYRIYRVAAINP
jgi:hypothetical protein